MTTKKVLCAFGAIILLILFLPFLREIIRLIIAFILALALLAMMYLGLLLIMCLVRKVLLWIQENVEF